MKSELAIRPMHHRKAECIKVHVLLCWLALLLVRLIEGRCKQTWPQVGQEMDRLHRGVFETTSGRFGQRTELTAQQQSYLKLMGIPAPPRLGESAAHGDCQGHGVGRQPPQSPLARVARENPGKGAFVSAGAACRRLARDDSWGRWDIGFMGISPRSWRKQIILMIVKSITACSSSWSTASTA